MGLGDPLVVRDGDALVVRDGEPVGLAVADAHGSGDADGLAFPDGLALGLPLRDGLVLGLLLREGLVDGVPVTAFRPSAVGCAVAVGVAEPDGLGLTDRDGLGLTDRVGLGLTVPVGLGVADGPQCSAHNCASAATTSSGRGWPSGMQGSKYHWLKSRSRTHGDSSAAVSTAGSVGADGAKSAAYTAPRPNVTMKATVADTTAERCGCLRVLIPADCHAPSIYRRTVNSNEAPGVVRRACCPSATSLPRGQTRPRCLRLHGIGPRGLSRQSRRGPGCTAARDCGVLSRTPHRVRRRRARVADVRQPAGRPCVRTPNAGTVAVGADNGQFMAEIATASWASPSSSAS